MPFTVRARVAGVEELVKSLDELGRTVRNRILRKALGKGSRIIVQRARQLVQTQTGLLKKSLGVVMRTYRSSGVVLAAIGPRTGFKQTATVGGVQVVQNPAKYAHLVELGRRGVAIRSKKVLYGGGRFWGKRVSPAFAHPFLRQALDGTRDQVSATVADTISAEIEKEAAKAAAKTANLKSPA
jgi:HK97 gp10 family phage protein